MEGTHSDRLDGGLNLRERLKQFTEMVANVTPATVAKPVTSGQKQAAQPPRVAASKVPPVPDALMEPARSNDGQLTGESVPAMAPAQALPPQLAKSAEMMLSEQTLGGATVRRLAEGLEILSTAPSSRLAGQGKIEVGDVLLFPPGPGLVGPDPIAQWAATDAKTLKMTVRRRAGGTRTLDLPLEFGLREELERLHARQSRTVVSPGSWLKGIPPGRLVTRIVLPTGRVVLPERLDSFLEGRLAKEHQLLVHTLAPTGELEVYALSKGRTGWATLAGARPVSSEVLVTRASGDDAMVALLRAGVPLGTPISAVSVSAAGPQPVTPTRQDLLPRLDTSLRTVLADLRTAMVNLRSRNWADHDSLNRALAEAFERGFRPEDAGTASEDLQYAAAQQQVLELREMRSALEKLKSLAEKQKWSAPVARAALDELWAARDELDEDAEDVNEPLSLELQKCFERLSDPRYVAHAQVRTEDTPETDAQTDEVEPSLTINPDAVADSKTLSLELEYLRTLQRHAESILAEGGPSTNHRRKGELVRRVYAQIDDHPTVMADGAAAVAREGPAVIDEQPPTPLECLDAQLQVLDLAMSALSHLESLGRGEAGDKVELDRLAEQVWTEYRTSAREVELAPEDFTELKDIVARASTTFAQLEITKLPVQTIAPHRFWKDTPNPVELATALALIPVGERAVLHSSSWREKRLVVRDDGRLRFGGSWEQPRWAGHP